MATQFNASDKFNGNLSNVNTTFTSTGSAAGVRAVDPQMTGKYYVEFTKNTNSNSSDAVGIANAAAPYSAFNSGKDGAWCQFVGNTWVNGTNMTSLGLFWTTCDMAVDLDNALIWFRTNGGNWNGSGTANPATGTGGWSISAFCKAGVFPAIGIVNSGGVYSCNFGGSAFTRTAPSGFIAWPTLAAGLKIDAAACKNNTSTSSPTSLALSGVNTSQASAILYVVANLSGSSRTVSSISDTAGLTWTRRKQQTYNGGANTLEIWTANAAAQLSGDTITVNFSGAVTTGAQLSCCAIAPAAGTILLDTDVTLPASASGSSTSASVSGYNTGGEDLVLGVVVASGGGFSGAPTPPAGWSNIQSLYAGISTGMTISFVGAYQPTAISGGSLSETIPSTTPWAAAVDATLVSSGLVLPVTTHAVGVSQSSTLTLEADLVASFDMGLGDASSLEPDLFLDAAPVLGVAQAVALTLEADIAASMALGMSQAGAPESAQELTPDAAALGFDTAVALALGAPEGGTHGVGITTDVALSFERLLSPTFSLGLAQALSPGLITLPANDIQIAWLRRDRLGGSPRFVQDNVPMSEATEAYDVEIIVAGQVVRTFANVATNSVVYTAAMQIADGWTQPPIQLSLRVFQLSAVVGRGYGEIVTVDVG